MTFANESRVDLNSVEVGSRNSKESWRNSKSNLSLRRTGDIEGAMGEYSNVSRVLKEARKMTSSESVLI